MAGKKDKHGGGNNSPKIHEFSDEILTSLPGLHHHTSQLAPDQLSDEPFLEIRTGQDDDSKAMNLQHNILGLLAWIGVIAWTIYIWTSSAMAFSDLILAGSVWILTFLFTIIGVPAVRRKARNRARHD